MSRQNRNSLDQIKAFRRASGLQLLLIESAGTETTRQLTSELLTRQTSGFLPAGIGTFHRPGRDFQRISGHEEPMKADWNFNPDLNRKLTRRQELVRGVLLGTALAIVTIAALRPITESQARQSDVRGEVIAGASVGPVFRTEPVR